MLRLKTINFTTGSELVDYELPKVKDSPYLVDDSHFIPMAEAVKQLQGTRPLSDEEVRMCYDFPDGKDTGMQIPITRKNGFADITEVTAQVVQKTRETVEATEKAQAKAKADADFKAKLDSIGSSTPVDK